MELEQIKAKANCCACETPLATSVHLNMVQINKPAKWPYPIWGNFITGQKNMACGYICDSCYDSGVETGLELKYAIEISDTEIKYHLIESL